MEQRLFSFTVFRIVQLSEVGMIQFWRWKAIEQNKPTLLENRFQPSTLAPVEPKSTLASFNLQNFYPIFLVYFVGITLSVLTFIFEVVFFLILRRFSDR